MSEGKPDYEGVGPSEDGDGGIEFKKQGMPSAKEEVKPKLTEAEKIAKIKEAFRKLAQDKSGKIPDSSDLSELKKILELDDNFDRKELERSVNVANEVLEGEPENGIHADDYKTGVIRGYLEKGYASLLADLNSRVAPEGEKKDEAEVKPEEGQEKKEDRLALQDGDKLEQDKEDRLALQDGDKLEQDKVDSILPKEPAPIKPWEETPDKIVPWEPRPDKIVPLEKRERIRIADVSEIVKAMAWRIAENRLNEIIRMENSRKGVNGFFRRFGRMVLGNLGERGYLTQYFNEAMEEITSNQDLMADIEARLTLGGKSKGTRKEGARADKGEQWEILDAVVSQMETEVLEDEEKGIDHLEVGNIFADLINRHTLGEFPDRSSFEAEVKLAIDKAIADGVLTREMFSSGDPSRKSEAAGLMYASNLWQVAEKRRMEIEAKFEGKWSHLDPEQKKNLLERIGGIGNLDIQLANKLRDLNEERSERPDQTRGYLGFTDRIVNWCKGRPILGAIFNPLTLGVGSSMITRSLFRRTIIGLGAAGGLAAAGGFALPVGVAGLMAGTFAYFRRHRHLAYDRGLEQRRETLGQKGNGRRAEKIRTFGFSGITKEAGQLIDDINRGDDGALLEAAALLQAEREMRRGDKPRAVDLISVGADEGEEMRTNIVSKTELLKLLKKNESKIDPEKVKTRVAEIKDQISAQDEKFEKFRRSESRRAAGYAAATGAVLGIAAIEVADWMAENLEGEANDQITAMEYLGGERPNVEHFELNGMSLLPGQHITETIKMPSGAEADIEFELMKNGRLMPVEVPEGFGFDPETGKIIHEIAGIPGVEGGAVQAENWGQFRELAAGHGFESTHVSWHGFGYNQTLPEGSSFGPQDLFKPHSEGTELQMDFRAGTDGEVNIDVTRMLGHTAFSHGHEVKITPDMLDRMVATISPHDQELQHEAILAHFKDGKIVVPKELADLIFEKDPSGHIHLKDGFMITSNQVFGEVNTAGTNGGETDLYSIAADYNDGTPSFGDGGEPGTPPRVEEVMPPQADKVDPVVIVPPIAIPFDPRRPIENPDRSKDGKTEEKPGPDKDPNKAKAQEGQKEATGEHPGEKKSFWQRWKERREESKQKLHQAEEDAKKKDESEMEKVRESIGGADAAAHPETHPKQEGSLGEVKIDTAHWPDNVPSKQYREMLDVLEGVKRQKNLRLKVHKYEADVVYNTNFDGMVRSSLNKVAIGKDTDGKVVYTEPMHLKPENEPAFTKHIEALEKVLRARENTARVQEAGTPTQKAEAASQPNGTGEPRPIGTAQPVSSPDVSGATHFAPGETTGTPRPIVSDRPTIRHQEPVIQHYEPGESTGIPRPIANKVEPQRQAVSSADNRTRLNN